MNPFCQMLSYSCRKRVKQIPARVCFSRTPRHPAADGFGGGNLFGQVSPLDDFSIEGGIAKIFVPNSTGRNNRAEPF
jgi:hypothetical protein